MSNFHRICFPRIERTIGETVDLTGFSSNHSPQKKAVFLEITLVGFVFPSNSRKISTLTYRKQKGFEEEDEYLHKGQNFSFFFKTLFQIANPTSKKTRWQMLLILSVRSCSSRRIYSYNFQPFDYTSTLSEHQGKERQSTQKFLWTGRIPKKRQIS